MPPAPEQALRIALENANKPLKEEDIVVKFANILYLQSERACQEYAKDLVKKKHLG